MISYWDSGNFYISLRFNLKQKTEFWIIIVFATKDFRSLVYTFHNCNQQKMGKWFSEKDCLSFAKLEYYEVW